MNNTINQNQQTRLARILKAKRLEQGKKLEEVSEGICSPSYLSRLENNLVKIQDSYMKLLFEKLDIKYNDIKIGHHEHLFSELIKKQLLEQKEDFQKELVSIFESNAYLDTEQQLVIFYNSIIEQNYEESKMVINKLEKLINYFNDYEFMFYGYLMALYYFNTNQINKSLKQLNILQNMKIEDEILYWSVYELKMRLDFKIGYFTLYVKKYYVFIKEAPVIYFNKYFLKHKFKMTVIESEYDYDKALTQMKNYYNDINHNDVSMIEVYNYHIALIYYNNSKYQELLEHATKITLSSRIIKLIIITLVNHIEEIDYEINKKINTFGFNKYEEDIKNLLTYYSMRKSNNITKTVNFAKHYIFNRLQYSFDDVIYKFIILEIASLNMKSSKYKETCNILLKSNKEIKNNLLDN